MDVDRIQANVLRRLTAAPNPRFDFKHGWWVLPKVTWQYVDGNGKTRKMQLGEFLRIRREGVQIRDHGEMAGVFVTASDLEREYVELIDKDIDSMEAWMKGAKMDKQREYAEGRLFDMRASLEAWKKAWARLVPVIDEKLREMREGAK